MNADKEQRFTYNRTWEEIQDMLESAERKQNHHYVKMQQGKKKERIYHMRNYKALEGAVKALRWTLGDIKVETPLE
tara:strand:+ start:214 stop:441 length:228 start_codon:yes stop_codon:yes gene_type:complete